MNDSSPLASPTNDSPAQPSRSKFNFWRWFWLSFLVVSLAWAWYDFYTPGNNIRWAKDYASVEHHAYQSDKPVILFFTGKWCSPCRIMEREVWADGQVAAIVNARFTAVMVDVDDAGSAAILGRYHVGATPTTVITDQQGNVLQQVQGGLGKRDFLWLLSRPNLSVGKMTP